MNRIRVLLFFWLSRLSTCFTLSYFAIITFIHFSEFVRRLCLCFLLEPHLCFCVCQWCNQWEDATSEKNLWDLINDERRCHRNVVVEINYILYHGVKITRVKIPVTSFYPRPPPRGPQELPVPQKKGGNKLLKGRCININ